ncbi:MAG: hypothetical protein RL030_251 [Pseudomonadota bacterium]
MSFAWAPVELFVFFGLIAVSLRVGWWAGRRRLNRLGAGANEGLGPSDAAVFGMMGLLLAFTFTGSASRFDHRRDLIVDETNAIGTAWLRLDLLQEAPREQARDLFRNYLDARLATYHDVANPVTTAQALERAAAFQKQIWDLLVKEAREDKSMPLAQTVLPPVNEMFDIASTRILATQQHPPRAIYLMLAMLVLVSAFLAGFSQASSTRQSLLHVIGFAAVTSIAIYLIIDMEFPRRGLIRVDSFDKALYDLRASMQ